VSCRWPSPPTAGCSTTRTRPTTTRPCTSWPGPTTATTASPRPSATSTTW
jgi:hypothetical protein